MTVDDATFAALRSARAALGRRPGLDAARRALDDIETDLRGRMRVALVGRVSAGKSTLTNALLGGSRAPCGAQELTYQVTWIRHGLHPSLEIHFRDGRPPERADIESLRKHVERTATRWPPDEIDHLEVTDPAPYLRSFDLIDTPGLDSVFGTDSENTLRFLGGPVDAMVLVVHRGIHVDEPDLLADFRGHTLSPNPINAIAALTKVEHLWQNGSQPEPMAVARQMAGQMMTTPAMRRVVHDVVPVASLVGAAAAVLTEQDLADLSALATVPPDALARWVRREDTFAAARPLDVVVPGARRTGLWRRMSPFGVVLACSVIRSGATELPTLRIELDERSGMAAFRRALVEHFGSRAELIMLDRAAVRVQALPARFGVGRSPRETAALHAAAKEFSRHAYTYVPRFRALRALRHYYAGELDLTDADAAELLRVVGEFGPDPRSRLGLPANASDEDVRSVARSRMEFWRERQLSNDYGGVTRAAVRVVVRGYEQLVDEVEDVRWTNGS